MEPNTPLYNALKWFAVAMAVFVVGATVYEFVFVGEKGGELYYRRGNLRLEDGAYAEALGQFNIFLGEHPDDPAGLLGKALALMGLERNEQALQVFNRTVAVKPDFGAAYADRGILLDRMGRAREALESYRKALKLDPSLGDGPGWFTRFMRSQWEQPPTIAERARYLESELRKPPSERVLRKPNIDAQQRSYKVEGHL